MREKSRKMIPEQNEIYGIFTIGKKRGQQRKNIEFNGKIANIINMKPVDSARIYEYCRIIMRRDGEKGDITSNP